MADSIYKSYEISLASGSYEQLDLPSLDDLYSTRSESYGATFNKNYETYIFDSPTEDIELVQTNSTDYGIRIPSGSYYVAGPWRRTANPPIWVKGTVNSTTVRVTIIKSVGTSCTFWHK